MTDRAADLRAAFDRAFALPAAEVEVAPVELLLVEVGGQACAILQAQIAALHVDLAITHMPTTSTALLGIAAVRNQLLPVYDLGVLLGNRASGAAPRWVVISAGIGLAFERFVGHLRVAAIAAGSVVRAGDRAYTLIDLDAAIPDKEHGHAE